MGFSPASMSPVSNDLNTNTAHSKPEADRARSSSCNPTSIPMSTRRVKRSRRKQNVDPRENLDNSPSGSRKAISSSSSVVVRGVERSQDNSLKDIVDKFGDHQIVKRKGKIPCPFGKCRRKFTREKDLERHINSLIRLDALRTRCPAPRCLFEGAWPDIVSKHQRKSEHGTDELGRCTCSALVCKGARNQSRGK